MKFRSLRALWGVFVTGLLLTLGCAKRELVSEETQNRSKKMLVKQEQGLSGMNQTPAEQAAARHEASTRHVDEPEEQRAK